MIYQENGMTKKHERTLKSVKNWINSRNITESHDNNEILKQVQDDALSRITIIILSLQSLSQSLLCYINKIS